MLIEAFLISALLVAAASAAPKLPHSIGKRGTKECGFNQIGPGQTGNFQLFNNPWGQHGAQGQECTQLVFASGDHIKYQSDFSWSYQPGGVKAYPHAKRIHNHNFHDLGSLSSTVTWDLFCALPNRYRVGASVVYDLFGNFNGKRFEMMLWLAAPGGAYPLAYHYSKQGLPQPTIRGIRFPRDQHTYDLFIGTNGPDQVYSFVVHGALVEDEGIWTKSWSGNLGRFLHYLATNGQMGQYILGMGAVLESSSFGIEASQGQRCTFTADLSITPQH